MTLPSASGVRLTLQRAVWAGPLQSYEGDTDTPVGMDGRTPSQRAVLLVFGLAWAMFSFLLPISSYWNGNVFPVLFHHCTL